MVLAGSFYTRNDANSNPALESSTVGTRTALSARALGNGHAGVFVINNEISDRSALNAVPNGSVVAFMQIIRGPGPLHSSTFSIRITTAVHYL
jgi:hypothetical protein